MRFYLGGSGLGERVSRQTGKWTIALAGCAILLCSAHEALSDVFAIAHRGGRIQGPENTLEVFQLTINLGVTPWLETDSWISSDDVVVLHHDLDMCRTTNIGDLPQYDCTVPANNPLGRFPWIKDFTLAELKALDVGSWFSPAFAGTQMPTLEEALQLVDGTGFPLLVEIKTRDQAVLIKDIFDRTGLSWDNIIIWARGPWAFNDFHTMLPGIRQITGQFPVEDVTDQLLQDRVAAGDYGISVLGSGLTQELVDSVQAYGLFLYVIPTSDGLTPPLVEQAAMGVDGLHTANETEWETLLAGLPCMDRIDNDGDGFIDFDGVDLDFDPDRVMDVARDAGCQDRFASTELAACQDEIDNDGDGKIDLDDLGCTGPNDRSEDLSVPALSSASQALLAGILVIVALASRSLGRKPGRLPSC